MARFNSFEGGTDGVAVTTANSGGASGDAFGASSVGANSTVVYSSAQAMHGTRSALITVSPGENRTYIGYSTPFGTRRAAIRGYFRFSSLPNTYHYVMSVDGGGGAGSGTALTVYVQPDGTLRIDDRDGLGIAPGPRSWTSTVKIAVNTWYRFEAVVTVGTTNSNGSINFAAYTGDSATAIAGLTYTHSDSNTGTSDLGLVAFGLRYGDTNLTSTFHMDSVGVIEGASTFIGPGTRVSGGSVSLFSQGQLSASAVPSISTLADDFAIKDTGRWSWGAAASVVSGQMQAVSNASWTGYIRSVAVYNLTGSACHAQVVQRAPAGNGGNETFIQLRSGTNSNARSFVYSLTGPTLICQVRNAAGVASTLASLTFDATAHAWWRFREAGGTVFYDTSPDALNWTQRASVVPDFPVTTMDLTLGSGFNGTEPSPGVALFDSVNRQPQISDLTDRFDGFDDATWDYWHRWKGDGFVLSGGRVTITASDAYDEGITTKGWYDLTNSSLVLDLAAPATATGGTGGIDNFIELLTPANDIIRFWIGWEAGEAILAAEYEIAGVESTQPAVTYSYASHRYLRFRHDGSALLWEVSGDGLSWTSLRSWVPTVPITDLRPNIFNGYWGGAPTGLTDMLLESVNVISTALDKLRLGSGIVSLRVGGAAASKAYIGTTQVWP